MTTAERTELPRRGVPARSDRGRRPAGVTPAGRGNVGTRADGEAIRFVASTFVPAEESCFFRFEGSSADLVARACADAEVPAARIHAVLDLREEPCDS